VAARPSPQNLSRLEDLPDVRVSDLSTVNCMTKSSIFDYWVELSFFTHLIFQFKVSSLFLLNFGSHALYNLQSNFDKGDSLYAGGFLWVLILFTNRMCNIQRDNPVNGSFTRVSSPPAYRISTVHCNEDIRRGSLFVKGNQFSRGHLPP
jgi:hypothetical protein